MTTENTTIESSALASRWSRLGAAIIDGLIVAAITLPLMFLTGGFSYATEGAQPSFMYSLFITLVGIIVFLVINGKPLANQGQTIGKKLLKIKIVTIEDGHAEVPELLKRYGFYFMVPLVPILGQLLSLVNILFIFSASKRCLHDHVGSTKVVVAQQSV